MVTEKEEERNEKEEIKEESKEKTSSLQPRYRVVHTYIYFYICIHKLYVVKLYNLYTQCLLFLRVFSAGFIVCFTLVDFQCLIVTGVIAAAAQTRRKSICRYEDRVARWLAQRPNKRKKFTPLTECIDSFFCEIEKVGLWLLPRPPLQRTPLPAALASLTTCLKSIVSTQHTFGMIPPCVSQTPVHFLRFFI